MDEIRQFEKLIERVKKIEGANTLIRPLQMIAKQGEEKILSVLEEKYPELVEPLNALFLIHFAIHEYVMGEDVERCFDGSIERLEKFILKVSQSTKENTNEQRSA